jgi:uncharacterized protein with NAD-binding domain and iron-sulfur cluster
MAAHAQTIYIDVDNGTKRLRVDITLSPPAVVHAAGSIVLVECEKEIVNDSDSSDDENVTIMHPAVVLKDEQDGKASVCWLHDAQHTADILLPKQRWPTAWKQRNNVHVLDTVSEVVPSDSMKKHPTPDSLTLATRCYDSKLKTIATMSYTEFMLHVRE